MVPFGIIIQAIYMGYRHNGKWQKETLSKKLSNIAMGGISSAFVGFSTAGYERIDDNLFIALMMVAAGGGGELFMLAVAGNQFIRKWTGGFSADSKKGDDK